MALVYEHWRPDTQECFYVGASCEAEDTRPYYYGHHNFKYDLVVEFLRKNGMEPTTKIIWQNIEDDCIEAYEKIRISYQRGLLGDRLTNVANGGHGFWNHWDDSLRSRHSNLTKDLWANKEYRKSHIDSVPRGINHPANRPEFRKNHSQKMILVWQQKEQRDKYITAHKINYENPEFAEKHKRSCLRGDKHPAKRSEVRKNISMKTAGKNNPMFGKKNLIGAFSNLMRGMRYWGA